MNEIDLERDLTEAQRAELGDLSAVTKLLVSYEVADPTPSETSLLLAKLKPVLAERTAPEPIESPLSPSRAFSSQAWLGVARAQIEILPLGFWLAGVAVGTLGLFVGFAAGAEWLITLIVLLAPLLAAGGVAYTFRPETRGLEELERISVVGPLELLYIRLGVVLAFNGSISAALMLALGLGGMDVVQLWRLVLVWLGPMIGLAGLALYISVRWHTIAGTIVPLGLWAGAILFGWREIVARVEWTPATSLYRVAAAWLIAQINNSDGLLLAASIALIVGLFLMQQAGQTVMRNRTA